MATLLHGALTVEQVADFEAELAADAALDYEPTDADWESYRLHLEAEERAEILDRTAAMEQIRRADFNSARSAACRIRGIAAALSGQGLDPIARELVAASEDVMACVSRYA